jgi:ABC-type dipeptide/oligopeptide/nickel transport system permease subunit
MSTKMDQVDFTESADATLVSRKDISLLSIMWRNPSVFWGGLLLAIMVVVALIGPLFTVDPVALNPIKRLKPPSAEFWFGTDFLGRDVLARVVHGAQVSLVVGLAVAVIAVALGLVIGLVSGYIRWLDAIMMRVMDGLMAIPGILLAIALISLSGATLFTVVLAIVIPEIPACGPAGALGCAVGARRALRGGGHRRRHPHHSDPVAAHPAQHHRAADRAGDLYLRLGHAD